MKIVHVVNSDTGGAANAAIRLHKGLLSQNINSTFLSKISKIGTIPASIHEYKYKSIKHYLEFFLEKYIPIKTFAPSSIYSDDCVLFTSPYSLYHIENNSIIRQADIVHLHWPSQYMSFVSFFNKYNKPVVWTLHDMNPFTGGCHYAGPCNAYIDQCNSCPQIIKNTNKELPSTYLSEKIKAISQFKNLHIISPSNWLGELSKKSKLFAPYPHNIIPNGFDTNIFTHLDKNEIKRKYNIPLDKINLLFVAHTMKNKMKGLSILIEALHKLQSEKIHLTIVGKDSEILNLGQLSCSKIGTVNSETTMSEIYNMADVFVTPSLRDNLPNTVIEAQLCGTPVIAFRIEGIAEMIEEGFNGFYAKEVNADSLAEILFYFLKQTDSFNPSLISSKAKEKYNIDRCVHAHLNLYRGILKGNKPMI